MIRALSTGDIRKGQLAAAIVREIWIGILLGITMGLASWVLGIFQGGMQIALVVSLTMIIIVIFSSFLGIILPLILLQLRIDPAIASNPLIASVTDIFGLLIYFAVASAVIGIT